jgi:hypothetical protein
MDHSLSIQNHPSTFSHPLFLSPSLSFYLSLFLSISLSFSHPLFLSISLSLSLTLSFFLSLSLSLSLTLSFFLSLYLSISLSLSLSLYYILKVVHTRRLNSLSNPFPVNKNRTKNLTIRTASCISLPTSDSRRRT